MFSWFADDEVWASSYIDNCGVCCVCTCVLGVSIHSSGTMHLPCVGFANGL